MANYNFIDRTLHRLVLQFTPIAELSFDIDQKLVTLNPKNVANGRHVFVSGLARAGTTILMRRFHETGEFRSLTYRDMPFVLAPNLWLKLSQYSKRDTVTAERAHHDGIHVNTDSPESLDEVFWRVFAGDEYIGKSSLTPHEPDQETTWKYVRYVTAILNAQQPQATRYLSKNNNNILRLNSIRRAFPQSLILVPFRDPLSHAASLLRQHRNFTQLNAEDQFTKSYMTWLAHHEFGYDHRPFRFREEERSTKSNFDAGRIEYWLETWAATYEWLENQAPKSAIFVCYEDLCNGTEVWRRLAELADVKSATQKSEPFRLSEKAVDPVENADLLNKATDIYARLVARARAAL